MSPEFLLALCFAAFVCLLPLAAYCLILAYLNHRSRPTMVGGAWDFVGVLGALSGFLLLGGPMLLSALHGLWRAAWLRGSFDQILTGWAEGSRLWLGIWVGYFLLLTVGSGLLLYARRRVTVIYNVDLARLREDLAAAVRRTGRGAQPRYDGLVITPKPGPAPEEGAPPDSPPPGPSSGADAAPGPTGEAARVEITAFRGLRHATLRWRGGDASVRGEVEAALADALRRTESPPNPGAAWLMTVASFLLFLLLFDVLFILSGF